MKKSASKSKQNKNQTKKKTMSASRNSAPAAVSDFLRQSVTFLPTKNGKGLRLHTCAPLLNIGSSGVTNVTAAMFQGFATPIQNATFNPINGYGVAISSGPTLTPTTVNWINPIWNLISAAFVRYKVNKMKFHYMPQSTSTVADQLVFAFANDPNHPLIGYEGTGLELQNSTLLSLQDSIPFMPWREWSLDVTSSLNQDQPFYCAEQMSAAQARAATSIDQLRLSQAGVFACVNGGSSTTAVTYGVLYLESEIELIEFCPITQSQVVGLYSKTDVKVCQGSSLSSSVPTISGTLSNEVKKLENGKSDTPLPPKEVHSGKIKWCGSHCIINPLNEDRIRRYLAVPDSHLRDLCSCGSYESTCEND